MDNSDYDRHILISHPECDIVEKAVFKMIRRSRDGIKKYGCDMKGAKMSAYQAIENALEEAMDQVVYLSKALYEMDQTMKQGDVING